MQQRSGSHGKFGGRCLFNNDKFYFRSWKKFCQHIDKVEPFKCGNKEIWFFFGVRYENAILYEEEWKKLAAEYPNFHYIQTVSRPEKWTGEKGYVQEKIKKYITDGSGLDNYICGLPKMVDDVRETCLAMGFLKEKIHVEKYV